MDDFIREWVLDAPDGLIRGYLSPVMFKLDQLLFLTPAIEKRRKGTFGWADD